MRAIGAWCVFIEFDILFESRIIRLGFVDGFLRSFEHDIGVADYLSCFRSDSCCVGMGEAFDFTGCKDAWSVVLRLDDHPPIIIFDNFSGVCAPGF